MVTIVVSIHKSPASIDHAKIYVVAADIVLLEMDKVSAEIQLQSPNRRCNTECGGCRSSPSKRLYRNAAGQVSHQVQLRRFRARR